MLLAAQPINEPDGFCQLVVSVRERSVGRRLFQYVGPLSKGRFEMNLKSRIFLIACFVPSFAFSEVKNSQFTDSKGFMISLERTMCEGMCPAYEVHINSHGQVRYVGYKYVNRKGNHYGKISQSVVEKLAAEVDAIGFFSLESCVSKLMDAPRSYITVVRGDRKKTILDPSGYCPELKPITKLVDDIDEAVKSVQWR